MKKKLSFILALGCCIAALGLGSACTQLTKYDEYQQQGYKISVTYDANGGSFLNRPGITLVDMFNPADYDKNPDGTVSIKLTEPTDKNRPTSGSDAITLTLSNHFFAGWYQTREIVTNDAGEPIDADGNVLKQLSDGRYVHADAEENDEVESVSPAYRYSDYWDFENDRIVYSEDLFADTNGVCEITLYAGWVEYYEFNYHYKNADGEWEDLPDATTTFDYKTTNAPNSNTADKDTIWLPTWVDGAMSYSHQYANYERYNFPKIDGTTFYKAYEDEACTVEIIEKLEHKGTLDLETGTAVNRVQDVYIVVEQGEKYKISTAQQLADNANVNGIYEIQADLDFTGVKWPATFSVAAFNGQMYGANGSTFAIKNVSVTYSNESAKAGGMFGTISDTAIIKNLKFENVTFDLAYTGSRKNDRSYGMLAGKIAENATVENVEVGGLFRIGEINLGTNFNINLVANGNTENVKNNGVSLEVYGTKRGESYSYSVDPNNVTVDEDGNVAITILSSIQLLEQEKFEINIG